jgi:hypothetical protein
LIGELGRPQRCVRTIPRALESCYAAIQHRSRHRVSTTDY